MLILFTIPPAFSVSSFEQPADQRDDDNAQRHSEQNIGREMHKEIQPAEPDKCCEHKHADPELLVEPEHRGREHAVHGRAGVRGGPADKQRNGLVNGARARPRDEVLQKAVADLIRDDVGGEQANAGFARLGNQK